MANKECDPKDDSICYLDSGASNQMCGLKRILCDIETLSKKEMVKSLLAMTPRCEWKVEVTS